MTILGLVMSGPEHVVVWADTELYGRNGAPTGFCNKLAVNARAQTVGAGAGMGLLLRCANAAVQEAEHVDDAAERASLALRSNAAAALKAHAPYDPDRFQLNAYLVAGWSPAAGRMLAYRLTATSLFTPVLTPRWATPAVDCFDAFRPGSDGDVRAIARAQMDVFREHNPAGGAGDLTIASLSPAGIFIHAVRDYAAVAPDHLENAA